MEMVMQKRKVSFLLCLLLHSIYSATSQSFIGVYFNTLTHEKPDPVELTKFLNTTYIKKVRMRSMIYDDPNFIMPMADIGVSVTVGTPDNGEIFEMSRNEELCQYYIDMGLKKYNLYKQIHMFLVGDKVFESPDPEATTKLIDAMKNMQSVINKEGLKGKIKVSTIVSTTALTSSDIPSNASFKPEYFPVIKTLLQFLREKGSPFVMSTFPYYDYVANPTPEILKLCLFQPNSGRVDPATGLKYTNMFAIKVDSMRNALNGLGYEDLEIVVAETGWPTDGDENEIGACYENARLYNTNLVHYLRSKVGTPLMPKKTVDTYIYTLLDEVDNLPAPISKKSYGIIHPDLTWKYDINLKKGRYSPPLM